MHSVRREHVPYGVVTTIRLSSFTSAPHAPAMPVVERKTKWNERKSTERPGVSVPAPQV